ncbi:pyrroline-5-carboxylate reductase [Halorhodospira halochloris]|uniref:pyrroline-5-carboxylate reductase n=1 Tax=Halorhodospira halochloris TaxID=1052 RepID=UPI001EE7BEAB|nr:pyrroline-5-carboxylate reductase [Halorhodospira halochloris]MCG5529423.1 pyrroline-5-carboxylate reductase [Halorhodospira halochloris]
MPSNAQLAFIGGGNMARSLIGGLLADGYPSDLIRIAEPNAERRDMLASELGIVPTASNTEAATDAAAVILTVKPPIVRSVAEELSGLIHKQQSLTISVAAGVRMQDIERWLGEGVAVVRTMPNTPSLVRSGATALLANAQVNKAQQELAESLMRAVGQTLWLDVEEDMDIVTAVSGSGPAYFFLLMEALEDAAAEQGLDRDRARLLVLETATGAARMALESEDSPGQLRQRVTSPGGTTESALNVLNDHDFHAALGKAVKAAADRAEELGNLLGEQ